MTNRFWLLIILICLFEPLSSQSLSKYFSIDTYYREVPIFDSLFCNKDSVSKKDCGFFEYYFTNKGNLIYLPYCNRQIETNFYIGTYSLTDSGIVCTLNKKYSVKMTYLYVYKDSVNNLEIEEVKDITDYNSGKFKKSRAYQQFFPKNNCPDFPYAKRDYIHNILGKKLKETPLRYGLAAGNVFESNKKYETIFVSRIKKITVISGL